MTRPTLAAAAAALFLASSLHAQNYPVKGTGTVVLRAARVIDGTGAPPIANGEVVVTDDRIVSVGRRGAAAPAGARVIDLSAATVMPEICSETSWELIFEAIEESVEAIGAAEVSVVTVCVSRVTVCESWVVACGSC